MRSPLTRSSWVVGVAIAMARTATTALAAPPPIAVPTSQQEQQGSPATDLSVILSQLKRSNYLFGDLFGLRSYLSRFGITFVAQETSEFFGNVTGGTATGGEYDGLLQAVLQLDTQRAFGHYGGLFNVSALQIHGSNLSADHLMTLQTASGIEADRSMRLWELWYDQRFLAEDRLDVRIGQLSADQEFMVSTNAGYFINTMFGWPALPSYDLPGGGPAYPLSAPAVRFRFRPINPINLLVGVFNGSPVSDDSGDPQQQNPSGTTFPVHGGVLVLTELQYSYPSLGALVLPGESAPLAHVWKIGAWYDSERFGDQRFDAQGVPLASPASSGVSARHHGDFSMYAVVDQMLWRAQDRPSHTLNAFARVMGTPEADRNLIAFSMNAGLVVHEPFRYRPDDTVGLGMGYARVSSAVQGYDRDLAAYAALAQSGAFVPIQSGETYLEATYQRQIRPWWQLQPDIQYVINPGAGIADPAAPLRGLRNELVIGVRTNILL